MDTSLNGGESQAGDGQQQFQNQNAAPQLQQPFQYPAPQGGQSPTDALFMQVMHMMQQQQFQQQAFFQNALSSLRQHQPPTNPEQILDSLSGNIKEFHYDAESNVTFGFWFTRYEDLFARDVARLDDEAKVRLLLRKIGIAEHERYISYILPQKPINCTFAQTVEKLKSLFGAKESVISRRFKCLQISKTPTEDHVAYACRVNKACVEFDLGRLSQDEFKCLIYVCGLNSEGDAEIRTRLLSRIEENSNVALEQLSEECQRLLNLRRDNAMIEEHPTTSQVNAIHQNHYRQYPHKHTPEAAADSASQNRPQTPCWLCGGFHYVRECKYKTHKCADCGQLGHREGYCGSARKSRMFRGGKKNIVESKVIVNVCEVNKRRKFVLIELNGRKTKLQLDTASDITIVNREIWKQIGSPVLSPVTLKAKTASGSVLPLVGEFLCDVTIAGNTRMEIIRVSENQLRLLGSDLADSFNLWSIPIDSFCCQVSGTQVETNKLKTEFQSVFSEKLGLCTKTSVKLELKENCKPVFCPKRLVAYAMRSAVDEELDRLEKLHIITPVDYAD